MDTPKQTWTLRKRVRNFWYRIAGTPVELDVRRYHEEVRRIRLREQNFTSTSDQLLRQEALELRQRSRGNEPKSALRDEVFAIVAEASARLIGLRPFDLQLAVAIALSEGNVVELATGEGKTLAAVPAAVLAALCGENVHLLTTNDYLARRDAEWMRPIYELFGLSVGVVTESSKLDVRKRAYAADVTYVTAREAGFDFLRDSIAASEKEIAQCRPLGFAIVDEADFLLIDESRVPLVIAGVQQTPPIDRDALADLARVFEQQVDYETDEYERNVALTERGLDRAERELGIHLQAPENHVHLCALHVALQSEIFLKRDRDYIVSNTGSNTVSNERIELVDELTGRVATDRRWPHGIQQAVEAKEGVAIQPQGRILGSVSVQHFVRQYSRLAGMTATAEPAAEELATVYGLKTVLFQPRTHCRRVDVPDAVFTTRKEKLEAVLDEIVSVHSTGRPILVGTPSVGESEELARNLAKRSVECEVLNARHHEKEASLIAKAGALGAVTISTNMAGRGTDIVLGTGEPSARERVIALGGLYVIGTSRHESRRIDDQLRGRAGRQGDPGTSRFFISLEDDLIRRYGVVELIPKSRRPTPGVGRVEDPIVAREVARAQRIIEGQHFDLRQTLCRYSELVEEQRKGHSERRRRLLAELEEVVEECRKNAPAQWSTLVDSVGELSVIEAVRRLTLSVLDLAWAEHLALIEDIREGVHLYRYGGREPLHQFHLHIAKAYRQMDETVVAEITRTFQSLRVTHGEIDLKGAGVFGTGSTWTYLVSDDPFSAFGGSLMQGVGGAAAAGLVAAAAWPITMAVAGVALFLRRRRRRTSETD